MRGEIFTPPAALAPSNVYPVESEGNSTGDQIKVKNC